MSDLIDRMRAKLTRGEDTRQLAVPVDLEDLRALLALQPPDERSRFVQISTELLAHLGADWSRPLQVRVTDQHGPVLELVLRSPAP